MPRAANELAHADSTTAVVDTDTDTAQRREQQRRQRARLSAERERRTYPSLAEETRALVDTDTAAFHLNRKPQTLRVWAMDENGPLQPKKIHGRLAWSVADLRRLTGAE